ncbi:hypothetical protein I3843_01G150700 [Carya illinoinensis]|nr:hypothetical protein I3843_01G150700 [Carya illinoinensis]
MDQSGSNREHIEAVEENATRLTNILGEVNTTLAELRMVLNATARETEENRRAMDAMRREHSASLERLERRLARTNGQGTPPSPNGQRQEVFVDGAETSVAGGRIENDQVVVERWICDEVRHSRSPSVRRGPQDVRVEVPRFEEHHEAERNFNHRRERDPRNRRYEEDHYDDRVGNRAYDWGPRRPKVDFPKFNGGDPYEWLDKVDHYFHVYEVSREERVSTACFHLEGRASKWWRWLRDQYDKERRRLGWTAFEKEFLMQFGPSPIVNHHGQLAKLKQEGKVHHYIDEFRQLQTLVRGWSEEALIGTFVDGLKPWLAKEIKLKQPTRLQEVMRMAEILEESTHIEKRHSKDMGSKFSKPLQTKVPWKGKEVEGSASKPKPYEVKKLSKEEVQERIKKGLCFKCGDKWSKDHKCKAGQAYVLLEDDTSEVEEDVHVETTSEESEQEEAGSSEPLEEAELSLNAISSVPRPTSMKVMAWVGKFEVTLLVDSGSTHNFINANIVTKIGLKPCAIEPFEVKVANGNKLRCEALVKEVKMNVQGVRIVANLHVLALMGLDVSEKEGNKGDLEGLPMEVREVLEDHQGVLEVPSTLPPPRLFDHRIVLVDEKKPVNVPPYRYAYFQKGEIERQVDEMLRNGLIRPSTSPFSSPVLLVRKKDGT